MTAAEFESALQKAGFRDIATRSLDRRPSNGEHVHDYFVRGLVTAGEFIITSNGIADSYKAGDVFEVAAGLPHSEVVGADGTCITTGRKY